MSPPGRVVYTADPADVTQVEMRTMVGAVNLDPHVQVLVENSAQVAHLISGRGQCLQLEC